MLISLGWVMTAVLDVFMFIFDTTVYGLAIVAINVFNGIARLDLFSTEAGAELYADIARRLYAVIGLVMIFFFAYQLVLLIINPDGDTKASTGMVKTTITSLIMIAFFPTLFKYMAEFQEHVLTEGTMTAIVLGQGASGADPSVSGKNTALIVYLSMYHPGDGGYDSLVDSNNYDETTGFPKQKTADECVADSGASTETCQLWVDAYDDFIGGGGFGGMTAFTINDDLTETINEEGGSTYYAVIIVVCGAVLVWFYFSYAIDLGYRTVKLGFLQVISPAPLVMRIFPKTAKTYEKWKHELIRTYLEVFVRVFIVSFIIAIIQKLPAIIKAIFQSLFGQSDWWCIPFALVAMIFGLLKFGKELPKLVKDVFDNGSGLFNGIDWKPGIGRRLEAGKDDIVGFGKQMAGYGRQFKKGVNKAVGGVVKAPLRAKRGVARIGGAFSGIASGAAGAIKSNNAERPMAKLRAGLKGAGAGMKAGWGAASTFDPTKQTISEAISNAKAIGKNAGATTEVFHVKPYLDSFKDEFSLNTMDARAAKIDELKGCISTAAKALYDKTGVTDVKTKADANAKDEIAKAREYIKNGGDASNIQGRAINKDGTLSDEIKTFSSMTEMNKYYDKAKKEAYESALENSFKANLDGTSKLAANSGQEIQEKFRDALSHATESEAKEIVSKVSNKLSATDLDDMASKGIIDSSRCSALKAELSKIEADKAAKETAKIERNELEVKLQEAIKSRDAARDGMLARLGEVDGSGRTIDKAYIESEMAKLNYDKDIADLRKDIEKKSADIEAIKPGDLSMTADELLDFLGGATNDLKDQKLSNADAAKACRLINDIGNEMVKQITKNVTSVEYDFTAAANSGGDKSGGDEEKK